MNNFNEQRFLLQAFKDEIHDTVRRSESFIKIRAMLREFIHKFDLVILDPVEGYSYQVHSIKSSHPELLFKALTYEQALDFVLKEIMKQTTGSDNINTFYRAIDETA